MKKAVFVFFAGLGIAFSASAWINDPCTCLQLQMECSEGNQASCQDYRSMRCWMTNPYDCQI